MPDNSFDVLIRFITEMAGTAAATRDFGDLEKQIDGSSASIEEQNKALSEMRDKLKLLQIELVGVRKGGAVYKQIKEEALLLKAAIIDGTVAVRENKKAHQELVKQLEKEKAAQDAIVKSLRDQERVLRLRAASANRTAAKLSSFGTGAVVAGVAIGGGIIAEATRYAEKMGDATAGTRKFNAELAKIERSRGRIDAVLVTQVTPILEMASRVADKVAGIIEDNPKLISVALGAAGVLVTVGTLAKIAAGGIRMYADMTYSAAQALGMRAAEMQLAASNNQLAAAGMKGGSIAAGAGGLTAGTVGGIAGAGLALGAGMSGLILISESLFAGITKSEAAAGQFKASLITIASQLPGFAAVRPLLQILDGVANLIGKGGKGEKLPEASDKLAGFGENTEQIVDAFMEMNDKIINADEKFTSDKLKITTDSNNAIEKANKDSAKRIQAINKDITRINEKAAKDRDRITSDFITSSRDESRKYESERANVIRDGGLEIQRIEQDRFEKLRQLEMDHNDRVDELAANRDALGLVLEQKKYDREKAEIDSGTNIEIEQRRQDLAIRLKDLAQTFQAERAQKLAQYQQDLADNEAKRIADIQIKQELLKEEQIRKIEEIAQIRQEAADRLRILMENHKAEILKIREAFTARRQELGLFLQGEAAMIRQAHQAALAQLQSLVAAYGNSLSGARAGGSLTVGHRLAGGYVHDNQVIQTHGTEFVASQTTTRALERLVGGRLNQNNLVGAVAGNQSIQLNDSRRFSGEYTKSMRREIQKDTLETLREVFKR